MLSSIVTRRIRTSVYAAVGTFFVVAFLLCRPAPPSVAQIAQCAPPQTSTCATNPNIDLAVVLDHSGSLDPNERGQTYNIQVQGLALALRNPSVIPRDGTVAISVIT